MLGMIPERLEKRKMVSHTGSPLKSLVASLYELAMEINQTQLTQLTAGDNYPRFSHFSHLSPPNAAPRLLTVTPSPTSTSTSFQRCGLFFQCHWLCHHLIPNTDDSSTYSGFCSPASLEYIHVTVSQSYQVDMMDAGKQLLCLPWTARPERTGLKY